ncbi:uncharacterized protein HaLaN_11113 [Haematococcus lacustris]|uniref:R3H domain-containing protein n=1 Tax=Haematococcus lacustris TaxID=44745 RepID=A0A699Z738_HAELA|nr:uncharacterized protein HaLaN_11113 [Haematococcus lacustris]
MERDLVAFVVDPSQRRKTLAPQTSSQRALMHELAEAHGLATSSTGHEPHRCLQLIKTAATGLPTRSLMATAAATSREEVAAMAASAQAAASAWSLCLVDVVPGTNIHYYLRDWAG